ncbi:hypothetical protein H9660_05325 [Clostridium sp. Sa3CUN1]|uniref:Phage protein n=1 Tax=Clostridium gallinarum TaxID=2762246 RepID=A0ABR8Q2J6_9CLOT|nr:hypothetical protein [Clostridium gallinarum]MBD7914559.1 hypothetical protein [Clostridium gallinarum]
MSINKLIIDTLRPLGLDVRYRVYSGSNSTYITFFELNNMDDDYSDGENETEVHSLQIDLWSKNDVTQLKKNIKQALKSKFEDVTYQDLYENDTKIFHIAFRCYFYEEKESELID